ncbi:MAG TPA: type II toxin-antitoxin system RelE/ParE family toxin [Tepidisphaeraceae bacterium]|nr:type II toxin-antitoxin system RelE/ParE family toxin [Tepidisphaeraceae bacterium]
MAYQIAMMPRAQRDLAKLPNNTGERIARAIDALANNPRPPGCVKLSGIEAWRIRAGSFRIIYEIHDDRLLVLVIRIGDRKDIYR